MKIVLVFFSELPTKKGRKEERVASSADPDLEDKTPCATCGVRFCDDAAKKTGRKWIECTSCLNWYHHECQGLDDCYASQLFTCIDCE